MKTISLLSIVLVLLSSSVFAEKTAKEEIRYLGIFENHVDVRLQSGDHNITSSCKTTDGNRFYRLDISERDGRSMAIMAILVKAYNDNEPIQLDISETECVGYAPKIVAVRIGTY